MFRDEIVSALRKKGSLTTKEIYALFRDMNPSTVSWHLHEEMGKGTVVRKSHGIYVLSSWIPKQEERFGNIPDLSRRSYERLGESGFEFYMSGLDCMNGLGFKVDGSYPVIVCTRKNLVKDVQLFLMREFDLAITEDEFNLLADPSVRSRIQFVVLSTSDFGLQKEGFAFAEKAFVDLYYAVTRLEYPLPVAELPHVLSLIKPNEYRFRRSTKDRGLSNELNFLLSYNRDFVKAFADFI
ncbi:MAG: hypothetical protein ILP16_06740 [Spirochaetales bacterium]|nr:hypothetical protein [Spirochaetales bacterium]